MNRDVQIDFDWDPAKARSNLRKHGVTFEEAATLFQDPLAQSLPDDEHSGREARWITQGRSRSNRLLVVSHTFDEISASVLNVRIISARPATRQERRQYENER